MSVTRIASRYAKSLIDFAISEDKLEIILKDIHSFRKAAKHRELRLLLASPIVKGDKKKSILNEIFKGKLDDVTMKFIEITVNKGRENYLKEIADEFILQYKKHKHISSVVITTADELSSKALDAIKSKLDFSKATDDVIEIETKVDPDLIGGFVIEFGDNLYDASIAHKLDNFKKEFDKNLYEKRF